MKKQYSAAFKAKVVQELLKEEQSVSQLAAEYGIHPNRLYQWRSIALEGLPSLFCDQAAKDQAAKDRAHAEQLEQLYIEIGKLTTQLAWLKKKAGPLADET